MRVAFLLGGTDLGRSGIGTWVRAVAPRMSEALARQGGRLVALGTPRELEAYAAWLNGVERAELPSFLDRPGPSALWHLALAGREAARVRADVLLLPAANRRMVWGCPLPVVAVVHDLAQLRVAGKYDPLRMAYLRHLVVPALQRAQALVAVSEATGRDLAHVLPSVRSVGVVPNGVEVDRFYPAVPHDPRVRGARTWADLGGDYLLYLSRLEHPGKNHVRLLHAFARSQLRHTHDLVLAGADWGAERMLRELCASLGIQRRVRWLGFVPDEHVPGLVAGAEAVIMVGLCEGFGLPALEALASGRPVVAASTGALPEVVGELGVLCDPFDVDSIGAALARAAGDELLQRRVLERGPVQAAGRCWSRSVEALIETCLEVKAG